MHNILLTGASGWGVWGDLGAPLGSRSSPFLFFLWPLTNCVLRQEYQNHTAL